MNYQFVLARLVLSAAILWATWQSGVGGGGQSNVSGGGGSLTATSIPNVINPTLAPYSAPLSQACAFTGGGLTVTSGSNVVSCTSATFTATDIGKVIFSSCCGGAGNKPSSVLILAQGVIHDIISSTSVHVCTTTGTCTPVNATGNAVAGAIMYWGFKATTAVQSALTAVYGGTGPCSQFYWSGILMVDKGVGNGPATCILPIGAVNDTNLSIEGTGRANSILLMSPDFDFTTGSGNSCGGLSGGASPTNNVCFFALNGVERKYFGINGGGRSNTGTNAVIILDSEIDDFDWDVGLSDIGAQDTAMICYQMDGSGAYPNFVEVDGCGGAGPIVINSGTANTLTMGYAADVKGQNVTGLEAGCMQVRNGATVNTTGFYFGPALSTGAPNCINVNSGGTWISNGDICISRSGTNCIDTRGGTIHLNNFSNPTDFGLTADRAIVSEVTATGKVYVTNSSLVGTVNPVLVTAGTVYIDDQTTFAGGGSNSGLAPTCTATSGFGTGPSCALDARSTNAHGFLNVTTGTTPSSSGTLTLTFVGSTWGASTSSGFASCVWNLSNANNGQWGAGGGAFENTTAAATNLMSWNNNGVALTASTVYQMAYRCGPQ